MIGSLKKVYETLLMSLICSAIGLSYILCGGLSWVSNAIGCAFLYLSFVFVLDSFKSNPIIKAIWNIALIPLQALYNLMEKESARRIFTSVCVCLFLLFVILLELLIYRSGPSISIKWLFIILYISIVFFSFVITTPWFERLFNRIRIPPMAEYQSELGRSIVYGLYLLFLIIGTVGYLFYYDSSLSMSFLLPRVILPAFVTYLALERLIQSIQLLI